MSRFWISSILGVLLVFSCLSRGGEVHAEILRLKATAVVDTPVVHLGDIADVLNADMEQIARMKAMALQPAPPQGRTQVITISQIRSRLQALGVDLSQLELTGKSQVRVSLKQVDRPAHRVPLATQQEMKKAEEKVQRVLADWLKKIFRDANRFSVTIRIPHDDVQMIRTSNPASYRFSKIDRILGIEQELTLDLIDSKGAVRQTRVFCQLQNIPEILAAKYTLNKGTVIRADDLIWVKPEKNQTGITDPQLVISRELTRTVHQSHAIRSQDLIEVPLIRDGAIVTVSARRGGITVKREMRARGNGGLGDPITLIALEGRDRLTATVSGYNQAEVNYRPANEIQRDSRVQFISGATGSRGSINRGGVRRNPAQSVIRRVGGTR
ncbi:flagellar basal body P-ring formation chaperone FlgA [Gimesia aquarii]|uniref:Flagellar basal body P-ring biosynthesis protein FlgA n=1 Tax=Gimesia aquarii TaxID=2527964 RepID=A0A517WUI5_9PLAN|nr:flagellar basal body P-ring formation chaperone FlgA [Gimesia aquarii]QDU08904.1 flagellar basal body P-ring biosynthesis protein FlgA [Gimesia aquarii]